MSGNNPYATPSKPGAAAYGVRPGPSSLVILACALLLTEVFATINTIEEAHPLLSGGGLFLIWIAGASQIPGLLIAVLRWRKNWRAAIPLLCGAYLIAITGCGAYAVYAFNGRAESIETAAHLHVIAFPVLHCMFAAVVYLACGVVAAVLSWSRRPFEHDEQPASPDL